MDPSNKDFLVEYYRLDARVNKDSKAVRVTHLPSGIRVISESSNYRRINLKRALEEIKTLLETNIQGVK